VRATQNFGSVGPFDIVGAAEAGAAHRWGIPGIDWWAGASAGIAW